MQRWLVGFMLFFLSTSLWAQDPKTLTYVGYENPPFYTLEGSSGVSGAFFEIMNKVCLLEKISCKFTIRPIREALEMVKQGEAEVAGPFGWTTHRTLAFSFSIPIFETSFTFFGLEKNAKNIKTYDDLRGLKIGTVGPSLSLISLQKINESLEGSLKIIQEKEPIIALKMAMQNSYPLVYTNREMARYWMREKKAELIEVPNLGEVFNVHIIFSKKKISKAQFERINKRLQDLKKDKTFEQVAKKYGLTLAK